MKNIEYVAKKTKTFPEWDCSSLKLMLKWGNLMYRKWSLSFAFKNECSPLHSLSILHSFVSRKSLSCDKCVFHSHCLLVILKAGACLSVPETQPLIHQKCFSLGSAVTWTVEPVWRGLGFVLGFSAFSSFMKTFRPYEVLFFPQLTFLLWSTLREILTSRSTTRLH